MFIDGSYNLLYIDFGDGYLPISCLTSDSFSENVDTLDSTTKQNGGYKTYRLTNQGYTISFDGLIINTRFSGGDFAKASYDLLKVVKRNRVLINWKIQDSVLGYVEEGQGYITDLSSESSVDEFMTFSGTILGHGEPVSSNINPENLGLESQLETLI